MASYQQAGATTNNTVIAGNYIGLNAQGTAVIANGSSGIWAPNRVTNMRIGTDGNGVQDEVERNVISGNSGNGIHIEGWTFMTLPIADSLISGALPRSTATSTINQADLFNSGAAGSWAFNNPIPGGGGDTYAVRATGSIQVNTAGTYTFAMGSDDGGRLRINGADVIVDSVAHGFDFRFGSVTLPAGVHTFEWVGFEGLGAAAYELAVAVGGGRTAPVNETNGWQIPRVVDTASEIALSGAINVTAYYVEPGNLNTSIAGNYIGLDPTVRR